MPFWCVTIPPGKTGELKKSPFEKFKRAFFMFSKAKLLIFKICKCSRYKILAEFHSN